MCMGIGNVFGVATTLDNAQRKHSGWAQAASQSWDKKGRLTHSRQVPLKAGAVSDTFLDKQVDEYSFHGNGFQDKGSALK